MKQSLETPPPRSPSFASAGWTFIFMNAQGDLAPCLSFRKLNLGNIFEDRSVHDILQSSRDYHAVCACKKTDMKKCSACKFFNFCSLCLGVIHTETNSLHTINYQQCNYAHALYDFLISRKNMFSNMLINTKPKFSDAIKAFFFENKTQAMHGLRPFHGTVFIIRGNGRDPCRARDP